MTMGPYVLPELLVPIVATAIAAVPATLVVRLCTRWMPRGAVQTLVRLVLVTPIAVGCGLVAPTAFSLAWDEGRWQCLVCAKEEHQSSFSGLVYSRSSLPPTEFESWYLRAVGRDHEHDWWAVGCHRFRSGIACHFGAPGSSFFRRLPKLSDQRVAVALATRLVEADESDREAMLIATDRADGPFDTREGFEAAFPAWLDRHPEWR